MTATPKRARLINYSIAYAHDELVIVSKKEKPFTQLEQLHSKEVAVNEGYYADMYISGFKDIQTLRLESVADAFFALKHGRVDAFVTALNTVQQIKDSDIFLISPLKNVHEEYSLALAKNNRDLLEQVNKVIKNLELNGKLRELKQRWGLVA
jgi:polar amino acid transport system substrate-binding protein